jgi:O-antigen ligase
LNSPMLVAPLTNVSQDPQSSHSLLGNTVLYGAFGLQLFGPLAFGAVEPWSIFALEAGAAVLFVLWAVWQTASGELRIMGSPLFVPMLVFAALVAVQLATGHTAYRYETLSHARLYCAYGALCFLVVQSLRRTQQIRTLTLVFSGYGFGLAAFALVQSMSSNGKLYWLRTPRFGGWIYGPYVNHNHYAGLMEMLIPIPLIACLSDAVEGPRKITAGIAAALMATTIFLSGSRGGMVAFAVQMGILIALLIKRRTSRKIAFALGVFLVLAVAMLTWLGGKELTSRIASINSESHTELSGGLRLAVDRDAIQMFLRKPLLGWGLGVFPTVYPQYRSFYSDIFVNQAHDDYAQLLVETGALGFAAMLWFVVVTYYLAIKKLRDWSKDINGAVALATLLGITGMLVHSFVDFNLQIPANAALFYVLCVVAAMAPRFGASGRLVLRKNKPEMEGELSA